MLDSLCFDLFFLPEKRIFVQIVPGLDDQLFGKSFFSRFFVKEMAIFAGRIFKM